MSVTIIESPKPTLSISEIILELSIDDRNPRSLTITQTEGNSITVNEEIRTLTLTTGGVSGGAESQFYPGNITRVDGLISQVELVGSVTWTIARVGNYISTLTNGLKTWTFTRNGNNQITSWSIT